MKTPPLSAASIRFSFSEPMSTGLPLTWTVAMFAPASSCRSLPRSQDRLHFRRRPLLHLPVRGADHAVVSDRVHRAGEDGPGPVRLRLPEDDVIPALLAVACRL